MSNPIEHVKYIITHTDNVGYRIRSIEDGCEEIADEQSALISGLLQRYEPASNVYIMFNTDKSVCKVGVSDNPIRRAKQLGFLPQDIAVSLPLSRSDAYALESELHSSLELFVDYSRYPSVEYFNLPSDLIDSISEIETVHDADFFMLRASIATIRECLRRASDRGDKQEVEEIVKMTMELIEHLQKSIDEEPDEPEGQVA